MTWYMRLLLLTSPDQSLAAQNREALNSGDATGIQHPPEGANVKCSDLETSAPLPEGAGQLDLSHSV